MPARSLVGNCAAKLQSMLNIPDLPRGISDPAMAPAFCTSIQHAVKEFPGRASAIIAQHGLSVDEFEELQQKVNKSFLFRRMVRNTIKGISNAAQINHP